MKIGKEGYAQIKTLQSMLILPYWVDGIKRYGYKQVVLNYMNIFIDTNILFADPFFETFIGELLIKKAGQKELKIYISQITYDELIETTSKDVKSKLSKLKSDLIGFTDKYGLEKSDIKYDSVEIITKLKSFYKTNIKKGVINIVDVELSDFKKSLKDNIKHKPPFFGNKKEEHRDSLIWEGIVRECLKEEKSVNFLITNNTKDFFNEKNDNLDNSLLEELSNIKAYKSLRELFNTEKGLQSDKNKAEFERWFRELNINKEKIEEEGEKYLWNHLVPKIESRIAEFPTYLVDKEFESDLSFITGKIKKDTIKVLEIRSYDFYENFVEIDVLLSADFTTKIHSPDEVNRNFKSESYKIMYNEFSARLTIDKDSVLKVTDDVYLVTSYFKKN